MAVTRKQCANALRMLSLDAVERAQSGHPGMPMGMADIAEVLWRDFLRHNPQNPRWWNRDRFVLSNGHGSMLQYALLHLTGYDLSIEALQQFRQLHSPTPGHPEYGITPGVETTTGPLGQGIAHAVGMALAERNLGQEFNQPNHTLIDHHTYVFLGDGCLMEGVSHEVCALAGTLKLGKLIAFWDDNGISIDGPTTEWFTENVAARFSAYGWHVITGVDGHDAASVHAAILVARSVTDRPTLIACKTIIGFGAPTSAGTAEVHGAPLGETEVIAVRKALDWPYPPFVIPKDVVQAWDARKAGEQAEQAWQKQWAAYQAHYPELAATLTRRLSGVLPEDWNSITQAWIDQVNEEAAAMPTRKASGLSLAYYGKQLPELFGGSADLSASNCTLWSGAQSLKNYLHYGVREFGMFAIMTGMAVHGGFIPYGGTFLVFTDYGRNAIRLAALMHQRVIFVLTHDSIGLGEDGPTHQPIEHAASLRLMPNVAVWRPCDAVETAVAWQQALACTTGPSCLLLTRQSVPHQARSAAIRKCIARGAYILSDTAEGPPEGIFIATGSEVSLAIAAAETLAAEGHRIRVVSMPCAERFEEQDAEYRQRVLPPAITARVAIEAGSTNFWYQYVGLQGAIVGLDTYGASAPAGDLYQAFAITTQRIIREMQRLLPLP